MSWLFLLAAGILETVWAVGLKYTDGFTRLWPSVGTVVAMAASVWLLALAVRNLPLGTAYAVWTGIGAVGAVVFGIVVFRDPATPLRIMSLLFILVGLAGLKLSN